MEINISEIERFIYLLTGDSNSTVTWQIFYDPKNEAKRPELATHFVATLTEALPRIKWSQERFCGIYIGVNVTDGQGRTNDNVVEYRGLLSDFDDMVEPQWALTPHFVQKRDTTHGHALWLVSDITTADEFMLLQMRIAMYHGTDLQVFDPARVVRVSGSVHYKNPQVPAQYLVTDDNTDGDHKYTMADIIAAFPLTPKQDAELNAWFNTRQGNMNGTVLENNEFYIKKFIHWLENLAPQAILGNGSHTVYKVAGYAYDIALPLETTQELMWNHYNPRCVPVWTDCERDNFNEPIKNAYRFARSAAGCKTAVAGFSSIPPLPEPIGGWEKNKELNSKNPKHVTLETAIESLETETEHDDGAALKGRFNYNQAALSLPSVTNKSPHYDLAKVFDGLGYEGRKLIRCKKIFYVYRDLIWQEVDDTVIKAEILSCYQEFKPNNSLTKGIFDVLCDLVNVKKVQSGAWLVPNGRKAEGLVVFKNGMVDMLGDTKTILPHDSNLFNFNMRNFNYVVGARCPIWLNLISEAFEGNADLIRQLKHWFGYTLTADNKYQKFALFVGKSRAGKGKITEVMRQLAGVENTVAPSLSNLTKDSTLHALSQASLALIPDAHSVSYNQRDSTVSVIKAITGGDPIDYHVMYKGIQTSIMTAKVLMSTNNVPEFVDNSGALANRMLVFPFFVSFAGREDVDLGAKLAGEMEGICQWATEGLAELNECGKFIEAKVGLDEKEEIREDMFPLAQFVQSSCNVQEGVYSDLEKLFSAYKLWASHDGIKNQFTKIQFNKVLKSSDLNIRSTRTWVDCKRKQGFTGIEISSDMIVKLNMNNVAQFPPVAGVN